MFSCICSPCSQAVEVRAPQTTTKLAAVASSRIQYPPRSTRCASVREPTPRKQALGRVGHPREEGAGPVKIPSPKPPAFSGARASPQEQALKDCRASPCKFFEAGTIAGYCTAQSEEAFMFIFIHTRARACVHTHHHPHPPNVRSDPSPADRSMRLESLLFIQELAGHLKHQKSKRTRFNEVMYVTCPANVFVERQGMCTEQATGFSHSISAGKQPLREALSSHCAGTQHSQSHASRWDKHAVVPRTQWRS